MQASDLLKAPVFLHSSWRTGSTYVWAKFRPLADAYCYFEPLNEHLATATQSFIDTFGPWTYANHPQLEAPYLEEFRPLIASEGGVPDFPGALTYGHFAADRGDHLPALEAYFSKLRVFAESRNKSPVYGCVRTDLRLGWFRHHLAGVHIAIRRDHRRQFISYLNQAVQGNKYFLERGWVILGANRDNPVFAPLIKLFDVPAYEGPPEGRDKFYAQFSWYTEWSKLYTIFYLLHLLAMKSLNSVTMDLSIDLDDLTANPHKVPEVEEKLAVLTGATISFADCRMETYDAHREKWAAFAQLEADITALCQ